MKLLLKRTYKGKEYTIGKLYIDGKYFCDTLEDIDRGLKSTMTLSEIQRIKVKNETAIPIGTYAISTHLTSPKYSNFNKYSWAKICNGKVPRLLNVSGFEGILIHVGNTKNDTSGCILVGENKVKGKVINSTSTFYKLWDMLKDQTNITIEIQ